MPSLPSAFLEAIIRLLMPYFIATAADSDAARAEIVETLAAYATHTRAEMLHAAQIVAFAMSSLDTLADATTAPLSPALRVRFRGCANALNRAAKQHQDALNRRSASDDEPQPSADIENAQTQDGMANARAAIEAYRHRRTAPPADPGIGQYRDNPLWAGGMMEALNRMRLPHTPAPGG